MEKYYAQLENNICVGISRLNGAVDNPNYIEIPSLDAIYLRRIYADGQWTNDYDPLVLPDVNETPRVPIPKRILTKYEFRSLFTVAQKAAILVASKTDPIIEVFNTDMMAADEINLDYPDVTAGLDYLISLNLIPAELKNQIINGDYGTI